MAESLYYFIPLHPDRAGRLIVNAAGLIAGAGIACAFGLTLARDAVAQLLGNAAASPYLPLIATYLAIMLVTAVLEVAMVARHRYVWAASTYVITDVVRALALVLPVLAGAGLRGLLAGALVSGVVRLAVAIAYLRREFGPELRPDRALLGTQLAYATPFALAMALELAQATLHQYVVSYTFDAATFAIYAVGCLQIPLIDFLAGPAGNVMMVRMADARRRDDRPAVSAAFSETTRKLALVFFPTFALLVVIAHDVIVFLFTEQYAASVPVFRLWCVGVLIAAFQVDGLMRALAETKALFLVNVVRLVGIAALILPLLSAFGLFGPVIVTLLAAGVGKAFMLGLCRRRLGATLGELLPTGGLVRIALATSGAALITAGVARALETVPLVRLGVSGAVYAAVYLVLLFASGALTHGERRALSFGLRRATWNEVAS
jgi:O-antigen/teichoic acid export membrane protein